MYNKGFPLKDDCFAYIAPEFSNISKGVFYEEAEAYVTEAAIIKLTWLPSV